MKDQWYININRKILLIIISYLGGNNFTQLACVNCYFYDFLRHELWSDGEEEAYNLQKMFSSSIGFPQRAPHPSELLQYHQQYPFQRRLVYPIVFPGTVVIMSCFRCLTHVSLGRIRYESCFKVLDSDILILVTSLGYRLQSLQLLKLGSLTYQTVRSIFSHCTALSSLTIFHCSGIRSSYHSLLAHSLSNQPPKKPPRVFSKNSSLVTLHYLDLRYSIDFSDHLLQEIQVALRSVDIFLGSNEYIPLITPTSCVSCFQSTVTALGTNSGSFYSITSPAWKKFLNSFSSSLLLHVDDSYQECKYDQSMQSSQSLPSQRGKEPIEQWEWFLHCPQFISLHPQKYFNRKNERFQEDYQEIEDILKRLPIPLHSKIFSSLLHR